MAHKGKKVNVKRNELVEVHIHGGINITVNKAASSNERRNSGPNIGNIMGIVTALDSILGPSTKSDVTPESIERFVAHNIKICEEKIKNSSDPRDNVAWQMRLDGLTRFSEAVQRFKEDEAAIDAYYETEKKFEGQKSEERAESEDELNKKAAQN